MTKIFKPIKAYLAGHGIRHTIFIDDGRVVSETADKSARDFTFSLETLEKSGWIIAKEKTDKEAEGSTVAEYLGFVIDTNKMAVGLTEEKKGGLRKAVTEVIQHGRKSMRVKVLARCLGKMVSAEPALGSFPLITARQAYQDLEKEVKRKGWNSSVNLSQDAIASLGVFLERFEEFNFTPIKTPATAISVISILGPPTEFMKLEVIPNHVREASKEVWCGDASQFAVCSYALKADKKIFFRGSLSEEERKFSSGHRELLTIKYTLQDKLLNSKDQKEKKNVYWVTDSANLVAFLTKGSSKSAIQKDVIQVLAMTKELKIRIIPIHLLRSDPRIQEADEGSKFPDSDDWSIDEDTFQKLQSYVGKFTVDVFADNENKRVGQFFSNFWCPGTSAVDAFTVSWDQHVLWICPPVKLIIPAIQKIALSRSKGILIIPKWSTAQFWPWVYPDGKSLSVDFVHAQEIRPRIKQNSGAMSLVRGITAFSFLAVYFDNSYS